MIPTIETIFHYFLYGTFLDRPAFFLFLFGAFAGLLFMIGASIAIERVKYNSRRDFVNSKIEYWQRVLQKIDSMPPKENNNKQKAGAYKCPFCGYAYTGKDNLKAFLNSLSPTSSPFVCPNCGQFPIPKELHDKAIY